jgi:aspartyl-tRNA(Asn)/glutamyl-tRNA(Gln) amidotransferase subunit A
MSSLAASFSELTRQLASGELTAVELARQSLDQITRCDGDVKAFLHVDREGTLAQAAEVDRRRADHNLCQPDAAELCPAV